MVVIERAQTNTQLRGIHKLGSDYDEALSLKEFFKKQPTSFVF